MTLQGYTSNFPDADLTPPNVKDGVDIYGVTGTLTTGPAYDPAVFQTFGFLCTEHTTGFKFHIERTYESVNDIYFIVFLRQVYLNDDTGFVHIGRLNKSTGTFTVYNQSFMNTTSFSMDTPYIQEVRADSDILYFVMRYWTGSSNVYTTMTFDTSSNTFGGLSGSDTSTIHTYMAPGTGTLTTINPGGYMSHDGGTYSTSDPGHGADIGNSVVYGGNTYSSSVRGFDVQGLGTGGIAGTAYFVMAEALKS